MTPLTKEQAEALADKTDALAAEYAAVAETWANNGEPVFAKSSDIIARFLQKHADDIRDGSFIEVQHD